MTLRLSVCLLFSGTLFILGGCKKHEVTRVPKVVLVTINNCIPNPDPVPVHQGDKVEWEAGDNRDYTIEFLDHNEPTQNPFPVQHGVSNPAHPIKGYNRCKKQDDGYYCKYTVTSPATDQLPPCTIDPGLHVVP